MKRLLSMVLLGSFAFQLHASAPTDFASIETNRQFVPADFLFITAADLSEQSLAKIQSDFETAVKKYNYLMQQMKPYQAILFNPQASQQQITTAQQELQKLDQDIKKPMRKAMQAKIQYAFLQMNQNEQMRTITLFTKIKNVQDAYKNQEQIFEKARATNNQNSNQKNAEAFNTAMNNASKAYQNFIQNNDVQRLTNLFNNRFSQRLSRRTISPALMR